MEPLGFAYAMRNLLNTYGLGVQCSMAHMQERDSFRKGVKMKIFLLITIIYPKR